MLSLINEAFLRLSLRAETTDRAHLVQTFVDVGPLFIRFSSRDHQILFGRRGTGKTHALSYLADQVEKKGDIAVQIDLRTIGSSGGLYSDPNIPLTERATRLLMDVLSAVHDKLRRAVISRADDFDISLVGPFLDQFAESITQVIVAGEVEHKGVITDERRDGRDKEARIEIRSEGVNAKWGEKTTEHSMQRLERSYIETGKLRHRVHFGSVGNMLSEIQNCITPKRIWILLDEWSEVPHDLQPILADLLKRSVFPLGGVIVKIAAIEQRSYFRTVNEGGESVGIEVGADIASVLSLDDFMVFNNDAERAKEFFKNLLTKHVYSAWDSDASLFPNSPDALIQQAFTQVTAFEEFVRASEGVPRDAIDIIGTAAEHAAADRISVQHIRQAAKLRYQRGKEASVTANPRAIALLRWIIDRVIAHRRARAFLLRSDAQHLLIDMLFDARVLHVIKHGVSGRDEPGVRYDVYVIDFGCYVDLINTTRAPQGLFGVDTDEELIYSEVPQDDYRSIRRAILNLNEFETDSEK